jgi:hypothetical protein
VAHTAGQVEGARYWFEICEASGGALWAAQQAYEDARRIHDQASLREQAVRELMRLAARAVAEAEQRRQALGVLGELEGQGADERLVTLATPGTRMWVIPDYCPDGYKGYGRPGTSLGMTVPARDGLVVIKTEGHDQPYCWLRLNPIAALTLAEARDRWWITFGGNLVSGGVPDRSRMDALVDEKFPGYEVQQGKDFIPEEGSA